MLTENQYTQEQRMEALHKANAIRMRRACVRQALKEGRMQLAEAIVDESVQTMKLAALLRCQRMVGAVKVHKQLKVLGASEATIVGNLTERQRTLLTLTGPERRVFGCDRNGRV